MKWRENIAMKALAFIAAVAAFTATAIMGWYQLANFNALWDVSSDSLGYTASYWLSQDQSSVRHLLSLYSLQDTGAELDLVEQRELEQLEEQLDPSHTNLRWQLLDKDGKIIYGNTQEDSSKVRTDYLSSYSRPVPRDGYVANSGWVYWDRYMYADAVNWGDFAARCYNDAWREALPELVELARQYPERERYERYNTSEFDFLSVTLDTVLCDGDNYTPVLTVDTLEGDRYVYFATIRACLEPNLFGFLFDPNTLSWEYDADFAPTGETVEGVDTVLTPQTPPEMTNLVIWVDENLPVNDQYRAR